MHIAFFDVNDRLNRINGVEGCRIDRLSPHDFPGLGREIQRGTGLSPIMAFLLGQCFVLSLDFEASVAPAFDPPCPPAKTSANPPPSF